MLSSSRHSSKYRPGRRFRGISRRLLLSCGIALGLPATAGAQGSAAENGEQAAREEILRLLRQSPPDTAGLDVALARLGAAEAARAARARAAALAAAAPRLLHDPSDIPAGNPEGALTLVEFDDLDCPPCRALAPMLDRLLRQDRRIRLVHKDLPILGPASEFAARAVLAAARQGAYLELRARLMAARAPVSAALVAREAAALGLDPARLARDMADPAIARKLVANRALAAELGIDTVPSLVVGGEIVQGAVGMDDLRAALASAGG
jgi:protein-disulfide isomerase